MRLGSCSGVKESGAVGELGWVGALEWRTLAGLVNFAGFLLDTVDVQDFYLLLLEDDIILSYLSKKFKKYALVYTVTHIYMIQVINLNTVVCECLSYLFVVFFRFGAY